MAVHYLPDPPLTEHDVESAVFLAIAMERKRCIAEIRRIQKRNIATNDGKPNTWNSAVETMAAECIDAING